MFSKRTMTSSCPPVSIRSGISLMEVLISVFVIAIGLLGIAALIPVANYSLVETSKSDRSAACGQAAMRDICIRRLVELVPAGTNRDSLLAGHAIVVDPLLFADTTTPSYTEFGSIVARSHLYTQAHLHDSDNKLPMSADEANHIFRWKDDLLFDMREGTSLRPVAWDTNSDGMVDANESYSWFFTISPAPAEDKAAQQFGFAARKRFVVSVVVCYQREFDVRENYFTIESDGAYGPKDADGYLQGPVAGIELVVAKTGKQPAYDSGQWILLRGTRASGAHIAEWYRIAGGAGVEKEADPNSMYYYLAVDGPYWPSKTTPRELVILPGVLGVYTTTVTLDDSPEWLR